MSLSSFISDLYNSLTVSDVQAEAPPAEEKEESHPKEEEAKEEKEEEEPKTEEEPEKKVEEEEEKEEEEEEEEEPEDPAPAIIEACSNTKECKPYKHHYDECVERVTSAPPEVKGAPKEDCVEEFFHVLHCANTCAAPKLWSKLK